MRSAHAAAIDAAVGESYAKQTCCSGTARGPIAAVGLGGSYPGGTGGVAALSVVSLYPLICFLSTLSVSSLYPLCCSSLPFPSPLALLSSPIFSDSEQHETIARLRSGLAAMDSTMELISLPRAAANATAAPSDASGRLQKELDAMRLQIFTAQVLVAELNPTRPNLTRPNPAQLDPTRPVPTQPDPTRPDPTPTNPTRPNPAQP